MRPQGGIAARCSAALLAAVLANGAHAEQPSARSWQKVREPAPGKPRAIGTYGAGCLAGAARLPLDGPGYHVVSPGRRRYFGHPVLVAFIRSLGAAMKAEDLGALIVGDLGLPRGGPQPNGHASHQIGLDVDLWYASQPAELPPRLDAHKRGALKPVEMADGAKGKPTEDFGPKIARELELASNDPRVERIFVNPVLKRALCAGPGEHAWLHKLRPWWGHSEHFHVRLSCPKDSPQCQAQPALPAGDGCDQVGWWFSAAARNDREAQHKDYRSRVASHPALPAACEQVLTEDAAGAHGGKADAQEPAAQQPPAEPVSDDANAQAKRDAR